MSVIDSIANQAGRIVTDLQGSLKRARIEGERRLLQRQHRAALEALGERTYELVRAGRLSESELGPELAEVESKLMEIEAKVTELDAIKDDEPSTSADGGTTPAADPAATAFPMVDETPPATPAAGAPEGGPGPGWEAASRFFAKDDGKDGGGS